MLRLAVTLVKGAMKTSFNYIWVNRAVIYKGMCGGVRSYKKRAEKERGKTDESSKKDREMEQKHSCIINTQASPRQTLPSACPKD